MIRILAGVRQIPLIDGLRVSMVTLIQRTFGRPIRGLLVAFVFIVSMHTIAASAEAAASEHIQRGVEKFDRGDFLGAIDEYNSAIKADPENARAYYKRALANYAVYRVDAAIADADSAIQRDPHIDANPQSVLEWILRGLRKWRGKDSDGALADLERALQLDPKSARAYANRGAIKNDKHDLDGALADYNRAIELDPKLASVYVSRGSIKAYKDDLDGALADYNHAIELDPKLVYAYVSRGLLKANKNNIDGAVADYTRAIELDPKRAEAYHFRGNAKREQGNIDSALADYDRAIELDRKSALAFRDRGIAKALKGDHDGAMADIGHAANLGDAVEYDWASADDRDGAELYARASLKSKVVGKLVKGDMWRQIAEGPKEGFQTARAKNTTPEPGSQYAGSRWAFIETKNGKRGWMLEDLYKIHISLPDHG